MTTYFVAVNGNNGNDGETINAPLATIQAAVDRCRPGDTVLVRGGTYKQTVRITRSGTPGNRIIVDAYPGDGRRESVTIDGEEDLPSGSYKDGSVGSYPGGFKRGFVVAAMVHIFSSYVEWKNIDVINGRGTGIRIQKVGDKNRDNCKEHLVENVVLRNHRWTTFEAKNCSKVTLRNVEFANSGMYAPFPRDGTVVENGVVVNSCRWPPATAIDANDVILEQCICHENWGEGYGFAKSREVHLRDCVAFDNWRVNLYFNSVEGGSATRCLCYFTDDNKYLLGGRNAANLVFNNESGHGQEVFDTLDIAITNCIFVNGAFNLSVLGGQISGLMQNILVANNTFVNASRHAGFRYINGRVTRTRFEVKNNIFVQTNGVPLEVGGAICDDITFVNNLWWDGYGGKPHPNLRSFGDVYADPRLRRPNAPLQSGRVDPTWYQIADRQKPAVDAGVDLLPIVRTDYFGGQRRNHDIGAHEFGATPIEEFIFANFFGEPLRGTVPLTVWFTDRSTATNGIDMAVVDQRYGILYWFDPSYTFSDPGDYTISLRVTGPDGIDTLEREGYVVAEPMPAEIDANFAADLVEGTVPLTVQFTDLSYAPNGIETWQWLIDDQEFAVVANPIYTFAMPGVYTIALRVTGPDGTDTLRRENYVMAVPALVWPVREVHDPVQSSLGIGLKRSLP